MKPANLFLSIILLLTVSCKNYDTYEDAIIRLKSVDYYTKGVEILFSTDSIRKATKDYMKTLKPKATFELLSDEDIENYSNTISEEMDKWRWAENYPISTKDLEKFRIQYYYDGYLDVLDAIPMEIFADNDNTVIAIAFRDYHNSPNFHETLLFKDDEILFISRHYAYPHSERFLINSWISWTREFETLYFKGNRFHKRIVGNKHRYEADYQEKEMLEKEGSRKYEKYIGKAYHLRKLAQTIINDKAMDCRNRKSFPIGINSQEELADFFNKNADVNVLKSIKDPEFAFVERLYVKINAQGETYTVRLEIQPPI